MTRAMFATVVGRLYERSFGTLVFDGAESFTDADYAAYYGPYLNWCAEQGIVLGVGENQFAPDREITRQEMAAMLYRFAKVLDALPADTDDKLRYSDAASISAWAWEAAAFCQQTGVIQGRTDGTFDPAATATRAEVAAMIERFITYVIGDRT